MYECRCGTLTVMPGACRDCAREQRAARRHTGYDDPRYRRARKRKVGRPCERCRNASATSVHHIDGDPANNVASNLLGVCDDCKPIVDAAMRAERASCRRARRPNTSPWK